MTQNTGDRGGLGPGLPPLPMFQPESDDAPCCGSPPGPPASPDERPGYQLCSFVERFVATPEGMTPQIKTSLGLNDRLGAIRARLGVRRDHYRVAPGLYAVGLACADSPVLVTANYKLSFDALRMELAGVDAWILVLDTRGVNVWCAAGKKTFGADELISRVSAVGLSRIVNHRELIVPQLGAPGVDGNKVRKSCGFKVIWGPIRAHDLRKFLESGKQAEPQMRQLSFRFGERLVLVPVELSLLVTPSLWVVLTIIALSAVGPQLSMGLIWPRLVDMTLAYAAGIVSGAVAVPLLLPWLPWRSFYRKGGLTGLVGGLGVVVYRGVMDYNGLAMILVCMTVSSYAAMNFTGATPYASPSGVEKEMRQGIPLQGVALLVAMALWVCGRFWFGSV